ncbi:hypothetical protein ABZ869_01550 [Streptomyces sp. NPDC046928]|uniref:hypothetical protein n=1 Tax=Streptomyces sp. NPDC046928 TaxID=3155021 RepID=UPI0033D1F3B4
MSRKQGTHFWFMSLALITRAGLCFYRRTGHLDLNAGATRFDAFEEILAAMKEQTPELHDAVVLSFDIQPNAL